MSHFLKNSVFRQNLAIFRLFQVAFPIFRMLSKAQPGDLIFFGKITSPDAYEQAILDVVPGNLFHVAIVINALNVIHAASDGVVEEALDIVIKKQAPHFVEVSGKSGKNGAPLDFA